MPHGPKFSYLPDFEGRTALYHSLDTFKDPGFEIRVLTVWPNEDFLAHPECAMRMGAITKESRTVYDALSYYWGSVNDLENVIVHGSDEGNPMPSCEVPVTKNLTFALRHLHQKANTAGQSLEMWTDALCIHQRDAKERSYQVRIMDLIFQASRRVCVWLSDGTSDVLARKRFQDFAALCNGFDSGSYNDNEEQGRAQVAKLATDLHRDVSDLLGTVHAIMDLPYWRRG